MDLDGSDAGIESREHTLRLAKRIGVHDAYAPALLILPPPCVHVGKYLVVVFPAKYGQTKR
jgi:hypothetical protein